MNFQDWCARVNTLFIKHVGLDRDSWPDQNYYDMWEADYSPIEAVAAAVYNEYDMLGLETYGLTNATRRI